MSAASALRLLLDFRALPRELWVARLISDGLQDTDAVVRELAVACAALGDVHVYLPLLREALRREIEPWLCRFIVLVIEDRKKS